MERIAVGFDGSMASIAALRWAGHLARATGGAVVAINAISDQSSETPSPGHDDQVTQRQKLMVEAGLPAAGLTPDAVDTVVVAGDARQALPATAEAQGADLLVVGRSGAGGRPGFLHLGSVVEHIAHHITMPLAIIPSSWAGDIHRVVLGIDGSKSSFAALGWAAEIVPALGAGVLAVQVEEPFLEWTPANSPDNWRRDVEHDIRGWTDDLTTAGVDVTPIAKRDLEPADGLVGVASGRHADTLVIGSRGTGGFPGLGVGGVAIKVLHRCGLPLIIVPRV